MDEQGMLSRDKLPFRIMGKGFRYSLLMLLFSMFTPCMWADNHPDLTRQPRANNGLIKELAEADTTRPKKDTVVIKKIKEEIKTQLIKTSELLGKIEDPSVTNFHGDMHSCNRRCQLKISMFTIRITMLLLTIFIWVWVTMLLLG